jgi:hypothetical protein
VRWGNEDDERIKIHIKQNERNIELVMIMLWNNEIICIDHKSWSIFDCAAKQRIQS